MKLFQLESPMASILPAGICLIVTRYADKKSRKSKRPAYRNKILSLFRLFFKEKNILLIKESQKFQKSFKTKHFFSNIWFYRSRIRDRSSIDKMFYSNYFKIHSNSFNWVNFHVTWTLKVLNLRSRWTLGLHHLIFTDIILSTVTVVGN